MESLNIAWRKCVRRIFKIPYNTHCKLVPLICQDVYSVQAAEKILQFFINAPKNDNNITSMLTKHVLSGSRSTLCQTLNFICSSDVLHKYSLSESYTPVSTECDIY